MFRYGSRERELRVVKAQKTGGWSNPCPAACAASGNSDKAILKLLPRDFLVSSSRELDFEFDIASVEPASTAVT